MRTQRKSDVQAIGVGRRAGNLRNLVILVTLVVILVNRMLASAGI